MFRSPVSTLLLFAYASAACVSYTSDDADVATIAAEVAVRRGGALDLDAALALAMRQNPELRALEARVRAADAERTVPFFASGEWRGRNEAIDVMLDPIALLGLGPRGAAVDSADARLREAVEQLAVARWRTSARIAEAFAIEAALATLAPPEIDVDPAAYADAGLASARAAQHVAAARAQADAERAALARERRDNMSRLRELLGLPPDANITLQPPVEPLPQAPATTGRLLDRPDLALAAARFEVADAAFREAVLAQYPSFQIGPNISLRGDPLRAMAMLNLPLGMHGRAAAAGARRDAARDELEQALLAAHREAEAADHALAAATAKAEAARRSFAASFGELAAARVALDVDSAAGAFDRLAMAAGAAIRDAADCRRAVLAEARAKVARANAYGWPARRRSDREEVAR